MKVLVVGGAGYIGSHACKKLNLEGHEPIVMDNLERGDISSVKWGKFYKGDLRNINDISKVFELEKIDAVMHFAAYAYVGESVEKPDEYFNNNIVGTLNLIQTMKKFKVRKLIFSSTCAVYGTPLTLPVNEETELKPESPYGFSKLIAEYLIKQYMDLGYLDPIIFRYFNVIGSDPEGEIGENHEPETHILPIALEVASNKRDYFYIYGLDYNTKDGTCIRDYVHVNDLVDAHILGLNYDATTCGNIIFNLGNDVPYSVKDIINKVQDVTGKKINLIESERRNGDAEALYSSSKKATLDLNWKPIFTEISEAIKHAWNWELNKK